MTYEIKDMLHGLQRSPKAVVDANEIASKSFDRIGEQILYGMDRLRSSRLRGTVQGVPLRKSLYSLSFPLNPNIVKHLRYAELPETRLTPLIWLTPLVCHTNIETSIESWILPMMAFRG